MYRFTAKFSANFLWPIQTVIHGNLIECGGVVGPIWTKFDSYAHEAAGFGHIRFFCNYHQSSSLMSTMQFTTIN